MHHLQQGFTLIELMIAVAIVGILAAVGLPAYQDYTVRAKMAEVILALASCRSTITEIYQSGGTPPGANSWGCEAGAGTKYVASLTTSADGVVSATLQNITQVNGRVVTLAPLASAGTSATIANMGGGLFGWRCGSTTDGTNVAAKYLPSSCRT